MKKTPFDKLPLFRLRGVLPGRDESLVPKKGNRHGLGIWEGTPLGRRTWFS